MASLLPTPKRLILGAYALYTEPGDAKKVRKMVRAVVPAGAKVVQTIDLLPLDNGDPLAAVGSFGIKWKVRRG